jgi:lipopolysaccharide/colanic/teichoic acid biosynthesis glycosyltransferase
MTEPALNSEPVQSRDYGDSAFLGSISVDLPRGGLPGEEERETTSFQRNLLYLHGPWKRFLDILLVLISAPVAAVLVGLAALAIKFSSRGPVFFVQERLGHHGVPFRCYKLRTMVDDAEKGAPRWATDDDPRVTRVGRFLRQTRLDEIPQLFNIWRGDMSFVGPRPIRRHFARMLTAKEHQYSVRFLAKPGLTGWDQVHNGYPNTMTGQLHKFRYDLYYLTNSSFWLDLVILGKTLGVVLKRNGQ